MATDPTRRGHALRFSKTIAGTATAGVIAACGGGGGSDAAPAAAPVPTTKAVQVRVVDGPIANATVCLDLDSNGSCGAGEPTARTDATGAATLQVAEADVGRYPVVAVVGTDAVDADFGAVTTPFRMSAPADAASVVSPLSTLVLAQSRLTGATTAQADAYLQSVGGLSASLLSDYTKSSTPDGAVAARIARFVVLTTQGANQSLASTIGTPDVSGSTITSAKVDALIAAQVAGVFPTVTAIANDDSITNATNRDAALAAAATSFVAAQEALAPQQVPVQVAIQRDATPDPIAPAASALTRMFTFTDASNWSYRSFLATVGDATPDAAGLTRYYDERARSTAGVVERWGYGTRIDSKDDVYWNGSRWRDCPLGTRGTSAPTDAQGLSTSVYCDGWGVNSRKRVTVDIAGQSMTAVVATIRSQPGGDFGAQYSDWGPRDLALLGTETMPAGSKLTYQANTAQRPNAPSYTPTTASTLGVYAADIAAGGNGATAACGTVGPSTVAPRATSLEQVAARFTGRPCTYSTPFSNTDGTSGLPNEWWGNGTFSVGTVATTVTPPAGSTGQYYFTDRASVRIGFDATGSGITWYRCLQRRVDSSSRTCTAIGRGTWSIETLGDGRLMRFTGEPSLPASGLTYQRVLIERGGLVYAGYQNRPAAGAAYVQLNLTATNAFFRRLGVPELAPR